MAAIYSVCTLYTLILYNNNTISKQKINEKKKTSAENVMYMPIFQILLKH